MHQFLRQSLCATASNVCDHCRLRKRLAAEQAAKENGGNAARAEEREDLLKEQQAYDRAVIDAERTEMTKKKIEDMWQSLEQTGYISEIIEQIGKTSKLSQSGKQNSCQMPAITSSLQKQTET